MFKSRNGATNSPADLTGGMKGITPDIEGKSTENSNDNESTGCHDEDFQEARPVPPTGGWCNWPVLHRCSQSGHLSGSD